MVGWGAGCASQMPARRVSTVPASSHAALHKGMGTKAAYGLGWQKGQKEHSAQGVCWFLHACACVYRQMCLSSCVCMHVYAQGN